MHKVWLYAPGENASKWDVCLSQNIMCIGWDEMGNLLEYASKKEMWKVIMPLMSLFLILRMFVKCNGRMPENGRI